MAANAGPYVQIAAFCEKHIRGAQSGALSLINIVDEVHVQGLDPNEMPSVSLLPFTLIVNLWAGQTKGRYNLFLRPEAPSGLQGDPINIGPVHFPQPGASGVDTLRNLPYEVSEEGTYWFDLLFSPGGDQEDLVLTRIPLRVAYHPQVE